MPEEPKGQEPTQQTTNGLLIPVLTREEIEDALAAIAKPQVSRPRRIRRP
jgi:hypothetical protein